MSPSQRVRRRREIKISSLIALAYRSSFLTARSPPPSALARIYDFRRLSLCSCVPATVRRNLICGVRHEVGRNSRHWADSSRACAPWYVAEAAVRRRKGASPEGEAKGYHPCRAFHDDCFRRSDPRPCAPITEPCYIAARCGRGRLGRITAMVRWSRSQAGHTPVKSATERRDEAAA